MNELEEETAVGTTKIDTAWEALFTERNILSDIESNGVHIISAAVINQKHQARIMTKFDHLVKLPKIFKKYRLAILPDSRTAYRIGRFDCYEKLPDIAGEAIDESCFPEWLQSLSPNNLNSESATLLCAQHAGVIADVLDVHDATDILFTVFGRMSSGTFDFAINRTGGSENNPYSFPVDRAQCEIDAAFETPEALAIFEVKNQSVDDFHVRQLYYPYRLWSNKISKKVIPIFLTYSNEVFNFYVYDFVRPDDYNSIQLVKSKRYQIVPTEIELADVRRILSETPIEPEPTQTPFPQADDFQKIIDFLVQLRSANDTLTQEELTTFFAFNVRQTQYYYNAANYLGLVERRWDEAQGVSYHLTHMGATLMQNAPRRRNIELVERILSRSVFRNTIEYYLNNSTLPPRDTIAGYMQSIGVPINGTTGERRAGTVRGWVRWIMGLTVDA